MMYQLPNGKVINISLEEYLDLTDDDIQLLMSIDAGEHRPSPFHGSSTKSRTRAKKDPTPTLEDLDIDSEDELLGNKDLLNSLDNRGFNPDTDI